MRNVDSSCQRDSSGDRWCTTRDGRRLGYATYGDPAGTPLLFFPGTPHSRLYRPADEEWIRHEGIRFITVERPGFGISDFQPGRRLVDFPDDIVCLAEALGLRRFFVAGSSGGGPYVAVCAAMLPERIVRSAIVGGFGPLSGADATTQMAPSRRVFAAFARRAPGVLERAAALLPLHRRPDLLYRWMSRALRPDGETLEADAAQRLADMGEAVRPGMRGFARELCIVTGDWGFRLEDIPGEVHLWHGTADQATPLAMAEHLARRIPNVETHFIAGAGHLLWRSHERAIVEALVRSPASG